MNLKKMQGHFKHFGVDAEFLEEWKAFMKEHGEAEDITTAVKTFPIPMRPTNGGGCVHPLPLSEHFDWILQLKFNGWRVVLDTSNGHSYNRHGDRLSIGHCIAKAVDEAQFWFPDTLLDCEALARRHTIGTGTLLILDDMQDEAKLTERLDAINGSLSLLGCAETPQDDSIYGIESYALDDAPELLTMMKNYNQIMKCIFYEGFVAKRADSFYENIESNWWRKFRFTHES